MLDTFCFSNAYACTPRLTALALAPAAERQRAADACGRAGAPPPSFACVLKLLSAFQPMPNGERRRVHSPAAILRRPSPRLPPPAQRRARRRGPPAEGRAARTP